MAELNQQMENVRRELREARKGVKHFMRRLEREWWNEKLGECQEACERDKIGEMYNCLRKLGTRGIKGANSCMLTVNKFKDHFEQLMCDRYEEEPEVIEEVIEQVEDLREDEKAILLLLLLLYSNMAVQERARLYKISRSPHGHAREKRK